MQIPISDSVQLRFVVVGGVILGSVAFAQQFLKRGRTDRTEAAETYRLARAGRVEWRMLVQWAEKGLGGHGARCWRATGTGAGTR